MNPAIAIACVLTSLLARSGSALAEEGTVRRGRVLETARDVSGAVPACWTVPDGLRRFEGAGATIRFSVREDRSLIGERRISFLALPGGAAARELLTRSVLAAVKACAPLNLTPALGRAVAGRVFAARFIYRGPQGRGA